MDKLFKLRIACQTRDAYKEGYRVDEIVLDVWAEVWAEDQSKAVEKVTFVLQKLIELTGKDL
jgi:hypothetical protein